MFELFLNSFTQLTRSSFALCVTLGSEDDCKDRHSKSHDSAGKLKASLTDVRMPLMSD